MGPMGRGFRSTPDSTRRTFFFTCYDPPLSHFTTTINGNGGKDFTSLAALHRSLIIGVGETVAQVVGSTETVMQCSTPSGWQLDLRVGKGLVNEMV